MKANIPSRIAFAVSSSLESRIILDQTGAEKLVGMGDMLFSPVGCGKPTRIQGAFVSDEEREEVPQFIKEGASDVQQNSEIEEYMNKAAEDKSASDSGKSAKDESIGSGYDEMLPQAVEAILETKSCSVSMLQRRVKLGYPAPRASSTRWRSWASSVPTRARSPARCSWTIRAGMIYRSSSAWRRTTTLPSPPG